MKKRITALFMVLLFVLTLVTTTAFTNVSAAHASNLSANHVAALFAHAKVLIAQAKQHQVSNPQTHPGPPGGGCVSSGYLILYHTASVAKIPLPNGGSIGLVEETNSAKFTYHGCNMPSITNMNCYAPPRSGVGSVDYCAPEYDSGNIVLLVQDSRVFYSGITICTLEDVVGTDQVGDIIGWQSGNC